MKKEYIDITSYDGEGYLPMIDYESWRVAILRYIDELEIQNLDNMQKHDESDEVFVLLEGNCTLFVGGNGDRVGEIDAVSMRPLQLYNVKRGVWHTHTLDRNATVLIVENQNTSDINSPKQLLNEEQRMQLRKVYEVVSPNMKYTI